MSRNYGWGSRNAHDAARLELFRQNLAGNLSFSSVQTISDRFAKFHKFMKSKGIGRLELVDAALVVEYGISLSQRKGSKKLKSAYIQNLISAVNTVMRFARGSAWVSISPTQDCKAPKRSAIRNKPTLTQEECENAVRYLRSKGHQEAAAIAELAYTFGLRSKEASLLDTRQALKELNHHFDGKFNVSKGTKGGKKRKILAQHSIEIAVLERALKVQDNGRSIMPKSDTWKSWRNNGLRQGREVLHSFNIKGYHEF
jgi:site-specific recombinase XerD